MVTSLNNQNPARDEGYQQVQYIAVRHTLSAADTPANSRVGTIPAGSIITSIATRIITAVTGGTPVLAVGGVAAGAAAPTFPLAAGNQLQNTIAEAAGSELLVPQAQAAAPLAQPLATDVDIYVGTSGGATAGDVAIVVSFIKPIS